MVLVSCAERIEILGPAAFSEGGPSLPTPAEAQCPDARGGVLRRARGSGSEVVALVHRGVFCTPFALEAEAIARLMRRCRTLPMFLADACLVRMSQLHPHSRVFTTDSDFTIYRRNGRQVVPLLAPPDVAWASRRSQ